MAGKRRVFKVSAGVIAAVLVLPQLLSLVVMVGGSPTTYGKKELVVGWTSSRVLLVQFDPNPRLGIGGDPTWGYGAEIGFLDLIAVNKSVYDAMLQVRGARATGGSVFPRQPLSATGSGTPAQCRIPQATCAAGASGTTDSAGSPAVLDATIGVAPSADQSAAVR